jgi:hypothetical protein
MPEPTEYPDDPMSTMTKIEPDDLEDDEDDERRRARPGLTARWLSQTFHGERLRRLRGLRHARP